MNKIKCDKCNRIFTYKEILNNYPGGLDKENIICPYCGYIFSQIMTSGIIISNKID